MRKTSLFLSLCTAGVLASGLARAESTFDAGSLPVDAPGADGPSSTEWVYVCRISGTDGAVNGHQIPLTDGPRELPGGTWDLDAGAPPCPAGYVGIVLRLVDEPPPAPLPDAGRFQVDAIAGDAAPGRADAAATLQPADGGTAAVDGASAAADASARPTAPDANPPAHDAAAPPAGKAGGGGCNVAGGLPATAPGGLVLLALGLAGALLRRRREQARI